jgi:hypothetical protein
MAMAVAADEQRAQLILDSANVALGMFEHEGTFYKKLVENTLEMCGLTLLAQIQEQDRTGLLTPVDVSADGKWLNGCLLVLPDRAIVVWWTGTFRFKHFVRVYAYTDVSSVDVGAASRMGVGGGEQMVVRIDADEPLELKVVKFHSGPNLPQFVAGMLSGAVRLSSWDEETAASADS